MAHVQEILYDSVVSIHRFADVRSELMEFIDSFSGAEFGEFRRQFGDLASLVSVEVDLSQLEGLITLWNPFRGCFDLGGIDAAPTIEEYAELLHLPFRSGSTVFVRDLRKSPRRRLAALLSLRRDCFERFEGDAGADFIVPLDFLLSHFSSPSLPDHHQRDFCFGGNQYAEGRLRALAMAILGILVFPDHQGRIRAIVAELVEAMVDGQSIVPAILAETFGAISLIRHHRVGPLTGCAPLLHIWVNSHLRGAGSSLSHYMFDVNRITDFIERSDSDLDFSSDEWVDYFEGVEASGSWMWVARWANRSDAALHCDRFWGVPLMGLRGCTGYFPLLLSRQFGFCQDMVMVGDLRDLQCVFAGQEPPSQLLYAQGLFRILGFQSLEYSDEGNSASQEYLVWRANVPRSFVRPGLAPEPDHHLPPSDDDDTSMPEADNSSSDSSDDGGDTTAASVSVPFPSLGEDE